MGEILKLGGTSFHPSAANTGNENTTVLRGKNMMLRGSEGSFYFEAYGGHKNLNEPIPIMQLTGQISYVDGSLVVTGVGTSFKTELRFGQKFIAGNPLQVLVPDDIISNTRMIVQRAPDASGTLEDAFKPAHLFEINNQRGTLVWGNAVKSDRGNIIAVGEGRLRLNGELLAGDDFVASRRLKLAIFDPNTQTYTVDEMGFNSAPSSSGVSITVVAGGVKDMTQGTYSFRWSWADSTTGFGFSNPSEVIKLDASNNPIAITATNQRFKLDFTAGLPSKPTNADSIIVYRSLFSDPTQNPTQAAEGSWFVASTTKISALETGDILYIDVLDGELSTEVTFDNDAPPDADWVSFLAGDPILISCYGDKVVGGSDRGASPGPFVSPSRRGNRHGFPAATATVLSPPDTIIGFLPGVGRLFLLTRTGLPFAAATGQSDFPVETRAFWQTGFKSPYGLVFINDTLYAFTHKGPTRSIATGDVGGEQFAFAGAVEEITREWHAGYVHAVHDPKNELIVLIYSASHRNDDGFWVSLALPYYLRYGVFGPLIEISKPDRDMIVTGAASVGGKLQFLAGGRGAVDVFSSEEGSSEEGGGTLPINPYTDAVVCTGACGRRGSGLHLTTGSNVSSNSDIVRGSGTHTILLESTAAPASVGIQAPFAPSNIWGAVSERFYIYFETVPSGNTQICTHRTTSGGLSSTAVGIGYDSTNHQLRIVQWTGSAIGTAYGFGSTGISISAGQWYLVDMKVFSDSGMVKVDVEINGVALPEGSFSLFGATIGAPVLGDSSANRTQKYRIADYYGIADDAAYPIGAGFVRRFVPVADGVHNVTNAGDFVRGAAGANITNATNDSYLLVNDLPLDDTTPDANDYINQTQDFSGGAEYVEHIFGSPDAFTPITPPTALDAIVAYHAENTGIGSSKVKLNDDGNEVSILEFAAAGSTSIRYVAKHFANPVLGLTGWSLDLGPGDFNDLRARFGYSADGNPNQYLDCIMLEAAFQGEE
jgi:hypothetical protein